MAESKLPNTTNIIETYKAMVELVSEVNKIIIKNKLANPLVIKKIQLSSKLLPQVISSLANCIQDCEKELAKITNLSNTDNLNNVITTFTKITKLLTAIGESGPIVYLKFKIGLFFINLSIANLASTIKTLDLTSLIIKGSENNSLKPTVDFFIKLVSLMKMIASIGIIMSIRATIGLKLLERFFKKLDKTIRKLTFSKGLNIRNIKRALSIVGPTARLFSLLKGIMKDTVIMGLLGIVAIPALIIVTMFTASLGLFLLLFKSLKKPVFKASKVGIMISGMIVILIIAIVGLIGLGVLIMKYGDVLLQGLKFFMLITLGLVLFMIGISLLKRFIDGGIKQMLLMALSLVVFVGIIVMINLMIQNIQAKPFIILGIIMAACVGLYAIVGIPVVAGLVGTGAGVMLAIGGSLLLFALGIVAINKVLESNINPENFKGLVTVMWQLAKIYGIAAMLLLPVTLGAPTLILLGTSLTVFSIGLALVNRIVQNVSPANFENLGDCITTLIDSFKELKLNPIDMIAIGAKIKYLRNIIGDVGAIASIVGDVAKMQIPIKWNDKGFATEYRQLTNADFELATQNIGVILTGMLDAIGNLEISGELARKALIAKNVFANLSESITPVSSMVDCIQKIATMQIPDKWDKNGNAISYHTITPDELLAAKDSVKDILTTIVKAITSKDVMNLIDNYGKRHAKKLTKFFEAASHVGAMADVVVKLAQGNFVMEMDPETGKPKKYGNFSQLLGSNGATAITQNITAIISSMVGGLNGALAAYKPKDLDDISDKINTINNLSAPIGSAVDTIVKILENEALQNFDSVKSKEKVEGIFSALISPFTNPNINANDAMNVANSVEKTTSATSNFLNTLNSVDKGKLDTMREISRNLYEFSKSINGNFDALAEALSEKLVKVLDDLNQTLDKTGGKLDSLGDAIGGSSESTESMTKEMQKDGKNQKDDNKKDKNQDNLIKTLNEIKNKLSQGVKANTTIVSMPKVQVSNFPNS